MYHDQRGDRAIAPGILVRVQATYPDLIHKMSDTLRATNRLKIVAAKGIGIPEEESGSRVVIRMFNHSSQQARLVISRFAALALSHVQEGEHNRHLHRTAHDEAAIHVIGIVALAGEVIDDDPDVIVVIGEILRQVRGEQIKRGPSGYFPW